MQKIEELIEKVKGNLPFHNVITAETFIKQFPITDQAAIISALYVGQAHLNSVELSKSAQNNFHRHSETGSSGDWFIQPNEYSRVLYTKSKHAACYLDSFVRCATNSKMDLSKY